MDPQYRSLLQQYMGRGQKWQYSGEYTEKAQPPWRGKYWRGAWSPSLRDQQAGERYDNVTLPATQFVQAPTAISGTTGGSRAMLELHKTVTYAKKLDTRIRKLGEEKQKRAQQWEIYARDTKTKFLEQRREFEQDIQKIEQEIQDATQAGKDAAEKAKAIIVHGVEAMAPEEAPPDASHWNTLFTETNLSGLAATVRLFEHPGRRLFPRRLPLPDVVPLTSISAPHQNGCECKLRRCGTVFFEFKARFL